MADRLPVDANVIGYWGFDEADDNDPAIDESFNNIPLTFSGSPIAVQSRVGNARQFDGSSVTASPASSSLLQLASALTLIVWVDATSFNSGGSLLRTVIACDGSTSGSGDNTQYNLSVDNTGAVVFRHDHGAGLAVVWKTAAGLLSVNRFFSLAVTRSINAGVATVELYVNNVLVPWASITDNGSPTITPPAPSGGSTATFKVGSSAKAGDSAFWAGLIDELSVHNTTRTTQPYLIAAYFRITLSLASARFSSFNNVRSIGSFEMGGGSRWWTYERDQNLFVVRENSLGFYSPEVQLTTQNNTPFGAPVPAGASQPDLYYDKASDTLLVVFLNGGKIYKLTASAEDNPNTQNMPFGSDTGTVVKLQDSTEASRFGGGEGPKGMTGVLDGDGGTMVELTPLAPVMQFINVPSFGIAINNTNPYGYRIYQVRGGAAQLFATLTTPINVNTLKGTYYFTTVTQRIFGTQYFALPIRRNGTNGSNVSNIIIDWLGGIVPLTPGDNFDLKGNVDGGDIPDQGSVGAGDADNYPLQALVVEVNHTPIKINLSDSSPTLLNQTPPARSYDGPPLAVARIAPGIIKLQDGRILVAGGDPVPTNTVDIISADGSTVTSAATMPAGASYGQCALLPDGKVFMLRANNLTPFVYDPAANTWATTAALPYSLGTTYGQNGFNCPILKTGPHAGSVFTCGGQEAATFNPATRTNQAWCWTEGTGLWTTLASMTKKRAFHSTVLLDDGRILAIGGVDETGTELNSSEVYDPVANSWSFVSAAPRPVVSPFFTITPMSNGKILLAGGSGPIVTPGDTDGPGIASCLLYDPVADVWSSTGSFNIPRFMGFGYTGGLAVMPDAKVVAYSNNTQFPSELADNPTAAVEIYDPNFGTWTRLSNAQLPIGECTNILIGVGTLLVIGGDPSDTYVGSSKTFLVPIEGLDTIGGGEADDYPLQSLISYVNHFPIKISFSDPDTATNTLGGGQADHIQLGGTGRTTVIL